MKRCGAWPGTRLLILALLIVLAFVAPCHAQKASDQDGSTASGSELDLRAYQRELSRVEEASKNPETIGGLLQSLPDAWTVKHHDDVYRVPTKEIIEALRSIERKPNQANTAELEARLKAMRQQAQEVSLGTSGANVTEAQENLKKILERGEFREIAGPSGWDLMRARINRWILEHLIKLLLLLHISQKTGNAIAWVVLFAAIVLLFYAVYRWLTKSARAVNFRAEVEPVASDAQHWVHEAQAAADRGDFREAIHCAYWAAVAHLEDIRILPRDRARTPRESLHLLDRHPKEQGLLQDITRTFELIWYGYRPVSATEWMGTKELLEKMGCLQASIAPTVPS